MQVPWALVLIAVLAVGYGAWQLCAPSDTLWARQERLLLARGLTPQRSESWERSTRIGGAVAVAGGLFLLLFIITVRSFAPVPMSDVSIDGHPLTQQEWDECHHDEQVCVEMYANHMLH